MNRIIIILECIFINLSANAYQVSRPLNDPVKASFNTPVSSPDGNIEFRAIVDKGQFMYSVMFKGKPVMETSSLGLILNDADLGKGVSAGKPEQYENNETYPWRGKHAVVTDRYKGARISVTHSRSKIKYILDVRVYNDGVAFRYIVQGYGELALTGEATGFLIPGGSTVWYHGLASMHYEEKHKKRDVSQVPAGEWAGPPMTSSILPQIHSQIGIIRRMLVPQPGTESAFTIGFQCHTRKIFTGTFDDPGFCYGSIAQTIR